MGKYLFFANAAIGRREWRRQNIAASIQPNEAMKSGNDKWIYIRHIWWDKNINVRWRTGAVHLFSSDKSESRISHNGIRPIPREPVRTWFIHVRLVFVGRSRCRFLPKIHHNVKHFPAKLDVTIAFRLQLLGGRWQLCATSQWFGHFCVCNVQCTWGWNEMTRHNALHSSSAL